PPSAGTYSLSLHDALPIWRAEALEARGFVVGLPLDEMGDDTARATEVRRIAAEIEKRTGLPVQLLDERFTTAAALRAVREMGGSDRKSTRLNSSHSQISYA